MNKNVFYFLFFLIFVTGLFALVKNEKKPKIKVITFDFGGVIATTNRIEVNQFMSTNLNISEIESIEILKQLKEHDLKGREEKEFWENYSKQANKELPSDWEKKFQDAKLQAMKEIPGMVALVKDLQKQGYQTALLSNVRKSQAKIKRRLGHYEMFNPMLFSYELGTEKPNPRIFFILLEHLQAKPQEVLFIDNKIENILSAQAIGMDAIHFVNTEQLIQALSERGIEISPSVLPIK